MELFLLPSPLPLLDSDGSLRDVAGFDPFGLPQAALACTGKPASTAAIARQQNHIRNLLFCAVIFVLLSSNRVYLAHFRIARIRYTGFLFSMLLNGQKVSAHSPQLSRVKELA